MQKLYHSGFSLIELMIVVVIIGILSITAIPSYQKYIQRARFAEIISALEPFKTAVSLGLQQGFQLVDLNNNMNGIPDEPKPTKNLASIKVINGIITATATEIIANATLLLTPNQDGTTWTISGSCITAGLCQS